jgi:pyruvate/2-oxoglutarate dehydrogenase complex dihydrolipoamide acyltransferase (E2) component
MMEDHGAKGYTTEPFPRVRDLMVDSGWGARRKNMIHGFVELDVTDSRRLIREHKARTGEALSFTAFLVACLARAVAQDRRVHACRAWTRQLVLFDDVDVGIMIEAEVDGAKFPVGHVLRAADKRSVQELHEEIRAAGRQPSATDGMRFLRYAVWLPRFFRRLAMRATDRIPKLRRQATGTVGVSSVGMFGTRGGWGLGMPAHTLSLTVGGIAARPGVVQDRVEIREYLSLTLSFDHDVVDGGPAARFAQRFADLVEGAHGLEALEVEAGLASPAAAHHPPPVTSAFAPAHRREKVAA